MVWGFASAAGEAVFGERMRVLQPDVYSTTSLSPVVPPTPRALQEIWMAESKKDALMAFDAFVENWGIKYDKAVDC
jgi:hypothetical protein